MFEEFFQEKVDHWANGGMFFASTDKPTISSDRFPL